MTKTNILKNILANLPKGPWVYQMKNSSGKIVYVGKSVNLKSRVNSYFNGTSSLGLAKRQMVEKIASVEIIETRSETEALILETNLIKELRPKYNVLMKDDKDLAYVRILWDPVASVEKTRIRGKEGKYFGPYPSGSGISACLEHVRRLFKVRSCRMEFEAVWTAKTDAVWSSKNETVASGQRESNVRIVSKAGRTPPCMDYYIGICPAPCLLKRENLAEHAENVEKLSRFLAGERSEVIESLELEMKERAKNLEFEEAQKIKDRLTAVRALSEKQIARNSIAGNADAFIILEKNGRTFAGFCRIRDTELRSLSRHSADNPFEEPVDELSVTFLSELYTQKDADIPDTLFLEREIEDGAFLEFLKAKGVRIEYPKIWPKAELIAFLRANVAGYALRDGMEKISQRAFGRATMVSILEDIGFEAPKKGEIEFECYDISHTDGHFTVASRVVTTNGKAHPAKYRKYKIRSLPDGTIDDFASMREVMYRRTLEGLETGNFPTMFLIDGGKGQLSSAREGIERALSEWEVRTKESNLRPKASAGRNGVRDPQTSSALGPADCLPESATADSARGPAEGEGSDSFVRSPFPFLASLAKREEEIFTESREGSVKFAKGSMELALIVNLRDEAHRFAITLNRKTRSKEMRKNVLEELPGFWPVTRKKLLSLAGSIEGIRELGRDELETVLNRAQIETLKDHAIL